MEKGQEWGRKRGVAEIVQVVLNMSILFMVGNLAGMGLELALGKALMAILSVLLQA